MRYITKSGLEIHRYVMPGIESNMFITIEGEKALIIDPNVNQEAWRLMKERNVRYALVLITHEHYDHISGVNWLRDGFSVEVFSSEAAGRAMQNPAENMAKFWEIMLMDKPPEQKKAGMEVRDEKYSCYADTVFKDEMQLGFGKHRIRMRSAPGHSKGSALIWLDGVLFSGDSLVNGSGVICRLPGGNWKIYCEKTRSVIEGQPDEIFVCPGHGEPAPLLELRKYMNKFGNI